jgi:dipeptidase D
MKPSNYPVQPEHLWNIFYDFTQTPRPSKKEDKIIEYLVNLAKENKLNYIVDKANNVIIYVPGKNGRENDEPLLVQNHIDMVTDALHDKEIDFTKDIIETEVDGEWLKAVGTTLGADNGIGCAAGLATIFDDSLVHPPLELLFTVDEETGLNGALGLEHKYLKSKKMLNLDTEEWGSLYVGCAGGIDYELNKEVEMISPSSDLIPYKLLVEGFIGGHSGVDIHEQRGNAVKFLAEFLEELSSNIKFEIAEIRAGKAHNIIPRDAFANIFLKSSDLAKASSLGSELIKKWKSYLPKKDQDFKFSFEKLDQFNGKVISNEDSRNIINYMVLFPHGAHSYDLENRDLVSMSNNFAKFLLVNGKVYTQSSLRFFDREEVKSLEKQVQVLGKMFGMRVENHSEYPSWKPVWDNSILDLVKETYKDLYGEEPNVTAIHAGLECGILRDKIGPIDVLSFGPTITGAHSPDERVHIPSVEKFWELFKNVLIKI